MSKRPSYVPRSFWWADWRERQRDRVKGRVSCLLGRHQFKFGTWPNCYRCDKDLR